MSKILLKSLPRTIYFCYTMVKGWNFGERVSTVIPNRGRETVKAYCLFFKTTSVLGYSLKLFLFIVFAIICRISYNRGTIIT